MSKEKELTEQEKRKNLSDLILKKRKEGKVIFSTIDGFMEADLDNLVNHQPVDGLLYDLNRDLATCLSWVINSEDIVWVNNAASGIVIEYMSKQIDALRARIEELEKGQAQDEMTPRYHLSFRRFYSQQNSG